MIRPIASEERDSNGQGQNDPLALTTPQSVFRR
jgi:hypothetical protein